MNPSVRRLGQDQLLWTQQIFTASLPQLILLSVQRTKRGSIPILRSGFILRSALCRGGSQTRRQPDKI